LAWFNTQDGAKTPLHNRWVNVSYSERGMSLKNAFLTALQFLTRIPVPCREMSFEEVARATGAFPLVGMLIGLMLVGGWWLLRWLFPPLLADALLLAFWIAITGGLHLDGFVDCCDGLLAARPPEARLEILRDTAVGAYGVVGVVAFLLIKFAALASLLMGVRWSALLLAPTLGRWAMVYAIACYPYARPSGMGRPFKEAVGRRELAWATLMALAVALLGHSWVGFLAFCVAWIFLVLFARWVMGRIPGLTGDVYGALCELVEVVVLLTFVAAGRFAG